MGGPDTIRATFWFCGCADFGRAQPGRWQAPGPKHAFRVQALLRFPFAEGVHMNGEDVSPSLSTRSPAPARPVAARTRMLLEAPVLATLLRLAAPNVLNLLAITGLITFDGLFIGRLGADALAGVSLAFPWVMLMQHAAASGVGGGVSSAVARALGGGPGDRAPPLAGPAAPRAGRPSPCFSGGWWPG